MAWLTLFVLLRLKSIFTPPPLEKIIPPPLLTAVYQERVYLICSFVNLYKVLIE